MKATKQEQMQSRFYYLLLFVSRLILSCFQLQLQKTQYLQLGPNRGLYYGGSLPNVNQIGNGTVDVAFHVRHLFLLLLLLQRKDKGFIQTWTCKALFCAELEADGRTC